MTLTQGTTGAQGLQGAVGQGPHLRGLQGHALQLAARHPAQQLRSQHGLPDGSRSRGHSDLSSKRRRKHCHPSLDDHAVDPTQQHGLVRGSEHRLRQGEEGRRQPSLHCR